MSEVILSAENLCCGYNGKAVVHDAKVQVRRGEITCVIGPNGSGKTTLLKTLGGLLEPISGSITAGDRKFENLSVRERAGLIAVMTTGYRPAERMRCRDVAALGRYPYTGRLGLLSASDEAAVFEALELVGMEDLKDQYFDRISDGQRQRVLLARAIAQEPELMILDEPMAFLDIRHKFSFLDILKRLVFEKKIGVLMSVHEPEVALRAADVVLCLFTDGRIINSGPPEQVITDENLSRLYELEEGKLKDLYRQYIETL